MNTKYNKGEFITIPNKSAIRGLEPTLQVIFLWLCDHSDDTMQSFPSRKTLAAECGVSIRTFDRGMQELVTKGFIVKSARYNGTEQTTNLYEVVIFAQPSDNLAGGGVKSALGGDKNSTQNSTHLTQPIKLTTTNVVGAVAPAEYGNSEVNDLFSYWQSATGLPIQSKVRDNRRACSTLIKRWKLEGVRKLIDGVVLTLDDRYAPKIADFTDLRDKTNDLLIWGRKKGISHASQSIDLTV